MFAPTGMAEVRCRNTTSRSSLRSRTNPIAPEEPEGARQSAARVFKGDMERSANRRVPVRGHDLSLDEHFHFWTKHVETSAIIQPEQFVEIGEELAKEKGITHGERIRVRSNRGAIEAVAVVTKRIRPLNLRRQDGAHGRASRSTGLQGRGQGRLYRHTLTPYVGDANTQTPEFNRSSSRSRNVGATMSSLQSLDIELASPRPPSPQARKATFSATRRPLHVATAASSSCQSARRPCRDIARRSQIVGRRV